MKISDLPMGKYELTLKVRSNGSGRTKVSGEVVVGKDGSKRFITGNSLQGSFAPSTVVVRYKKLFDKAE